jgi:hypothetical protein
VCEIVEWINLAKGIMVQWLAFCGHDHEPSVSIKCEEYLNELIRCKFTNENLLYAVCMFELRTL